MARDGRGSESRAAQQRRGLQGVASKCERTIAALTAQQAASPRFRPSPEAYRPALSDAPGFGRGKQTDLDQV